jgi:hypothetical protein
MKSPLVDMNVLPGLQDAYRWAVAAIAKERNILVAMATAK